MVCNTIEFSVLNETPLPDVDAVFNLLRRRGAFFSHIFQVYRQTGGTTGWRMNIPKDFPWEPFHLTLKDSGIAYWIDQRLVERSVIPITGG